MTSGPNGPASPEVGPGRARARKSVDLRRAATAIFALTAILPLLLFVHALWVSGAIFTTEAQVGVLLAVLVAVLGFALFVRLVGRISSVVRGLSGADATAPRGETTAFVAGLGQVAEIGELAQAFSRLLAELRASTDRLEDLVFKLGTLDDMVAMAARIPDIQELLVHVLDRTMRAVGAGVGSIMLLEPESRTLRIVASRGLPDDLRGQVTARVGEGVAGKVVELGEAVLVDDIERDPRFARANDPRYGSGSFISVPLRVGERIVGVVNLARKEPGGLSGGTTRAFTRTDLQFLNTLMTSTAYAVDNARLLEEARRAARRLAEVVEDQKTRLTVAEQQVLQAAKLSALGQLVAGVAHEISNPLTVLTSGVELLRDDAPKSAQLTLDTMRAAIERAHRIVRGLLSFARQMPLERTAVDLGQLLDDVLGVAAADLRLARIEVQVDIEPGLPEVWVDRTQIEQVVINLVTNAKQAMAEAAGDRRLGLELRRAGTDRVAITVSDTGPGIPPDMITRVFDPFVTTKGSGGTGLGLAISYGIVQKHGGLLTVDSSAGRGATFRIELPVERPAPPAAQPAPAA